MQECDAGVCYGFFIFLNPPSKNFAKGQLVHTLQILGNQTVVCVGILRSCMYHQHTPCLPVYVSKCHTVLKIFCNTLTWTHDIATFLFYDAPSGGCTSCKGTARPSCVLPSTTIQKPAVPVQFNPCSCACDQGISWFNLTLYHRWTCLVAMPNVFQMQTLVHQRVNVFHTP